MFSPLSFESWLFEVEDYLRMLANAEAVSPDPTELKVFFLRKYQEYLASFD